MKFGDLDIIRKIDYLDLDKLHLSSDPADGEVTVRAMTVMLASDR